MSNKIELTYWSIVGRVTNYTLLALGLVSYQVMNFEQQNCSKCVHEGTIGKCFMKGKKLEEKIYFFFCEPTFQVEHFSSDFFLF